MPIRAGATWPGDMRTPARAPRGSHQVGLASIVPPVGILTTAVITPAALLVISHAVIPEEFKIASKAPRIRHGRGLRPLGRCRRNHLTICSYLSGNCLNCQSSIISFFLSHLLLPAFRQAVSTSMGAIIRRWGGRRRLSWMH